MLQFLTAAQADVFTVLVWIAVCLGVVLVTVTVQIAHKIARSLERRAVLNARMARIGGAI